MRQSGVFVFFLCVFLVILGIWYVFPSEGVKVGGSMNLRFMSFEQSLADAGNRRSVDVDSILLKKQMRESLMAESGDSVSLFHRILTSDPDRIHLPEGNYHYFDSLFFALDSASARGRVVRIMHYGDSQLEMDRISSVLRQKLQERFGGCGPGMVPVLPKIASFSVSVSHSGRMSRFSRMPDSLSHRDPRHRYGIMTQFASVYEGGRFTFREANTRYSQPLSRRVKKVSMLKSDKGTAPFRIKALNDSKDGPDGTVENVEGDISLCSWTFEDSVSTASFQFIGNGDVYGIMLDGESGVTVDNVALRGSSGNIFTNMDTLSMSRLFSLAGHRMIILEFGGNAMPGISSHKGISRYMTELEKQFDYFHKVAPQAILLFVGPADMSKSVGGRMVTWPLLPDLIDSLRTTCLDNGIAFWDTFRMMGGEGSMVQWVRHNPSLAGPDYIHFTTRGSQEVGSALSRSLLDLYDFYEFRKNHSEDLIDECFSRLDSLQAATAAETLLVQNVPGI